MNRLLQRKNFLSTTYPPANRWTYEEFPADMLFLSWKKLFVPRSTSKALVIEKKRTLYSVVLLRCVFPMLLTTPSHGHYTGSRDNFNLIGHSISFTCSTCIDFPVFWQKFTTYHVNIVTFSYSIGEGNFSGFVLGCRDFVSKCSHVNMPS